MSDLLQEQNNSSNIPQPAPVDQISAQPAETGIESTPSRFIDRFPEELKQDPSLQDIKDEIALAKGYVNAQKMLGNSVRIPSQDASKEQLDQFYAQLEKVPGVMKKPNFNDPKELESFYALLGRPATKDEYKLEEVVGDYIADERIRNRVEIFKQEAHQLGLTQKQVQTLVNREVALHESQVQEHNNFINNSESQLKKLWGHEYTTKLQASTAVAREYAKKYPDAMKQLDQAGALSNVAVVSMLSELAKTYSEKGHDNFVNTSFGVTPEEAKLRIKDIMGNKAHPALNPADPNHKAASEKLRELYASAYPEE